MFIILKNEDVCTEKPGLGKDSSQLAEEWDVNQENLIFLIADVGKRDCGAH